MKIFLICGGCFCANNSILIAHTKILRRLIKKNKFLEENNSIWHWKWMTQVEVAVVRWRLQMSLFHNRHEQNRLKYIVWSSRLYCRWFHFEHVWVEHNFVDSGNECGKRFIKCCAPVDKSERESHFVELKTDSIVGNFSEKMIKQKAFDD